MQDCIRFNENKSLKVSKWAARHIADSIQKNSLQRLSVHLFWNLPTGSTPPNYLCWANWTYKAGSGFKKHHVVTFNMDEYVGIEPNHPESYRTFMRELFNHVDIQTKNINLLDGKAEDIDAHCAAYEEKNPFIRQNPTTVHGRRRHRRSHLHSMSQVLLYLHALAFIKTLAEDTRIDLVSSMATSTKF